MTILLTAVLLKGVVPLFIWALIVIYLLTGIFFLAYGSIGCRRTRHRRKTEIGQVGREVSDVTTDPGPAPLPPRWFIRTAWAVHRALYRMTGGRSAAGFGAEPSDRSPFLRHGSRSNPCPP